MANNTTYKSFIDRYLTNLPSGFKWQTTPLQVYPLEFTSNHLALPTPLLQADYHFIVYLNKGGFSEQIGIENYDIKAPSVIFVQEGETFSIKYKEQELSGFFLLLEDKAISPTLSKGELSDIFAIDTVISLNSRENQWINTVCGLLFKEVSSLNPNRKIGTGLLQVLLHKLIELSDGERTISRQNEIANNFKQLLNKHFKEHKLVQFYAKELNVSENYLNRCVKTRYNKSCKQVIQETTILQSQILMFESTGDISDICFQIGFEDLSHFSRVFKKVTGQTPSEFKKQIMHDLS